MPNAVKTEHQEKLWSKAYAQAKKEGEAKNYKYIMSIYESMIGGDAADSVTEDSNRTMTPFNHLKIAECILTAESVDDYMGSELPSGYGLDPSKMYKVYRPKAELQKAIESYNNVPLTNEHFFVDGKTVNKDKWLGATGSDAKMVDGKLINSIAIFDKNGVELAERVKQGLSCGYSFNLVDKKGVWNGQPYDYEMKDLVCNHVALVATPRVKVAKLADSLKNIYLRGDEMSAKAILAILMDKHPQLVADAAAEVEKEESMDKKKGKDKKSKDESYVQGTKGGASGTDEESEEEEMKDKKKAKDKKKKGKDNSEEEGMCDTAANLTADDVSRMVQEQLTAYNSAKELCEKAIGKTAFAADTSPEKMYDITLKALNVKTTGHSVDTKAALLQHIADSKKVQKAQPKIVAADSSASNDFNIIEL